MREAFQEAQARVYANNVIDGVGLTEFKRLTLPDYQHAAHLALLDARLTQVARYVETGGAEGIGRLIVSMPPRHGKTASAVRAFPSWFMGRNPSKNIIMAGYGHSLIVESSRAVRNMLQSPEYKGIYPHIALAADANQMDAFDTTLGGKLRAMGVGGAVTGKGAHLLIVDDPIKRRQEAESATIRNSIWAWFTDDFLSRRDSASAAVVVVMTRWHTDDLIGRILLNYPDEYEYLRLPALAESDDPLGREEGAALWSERYPATYFDTWRNLPYTFAGLYQQRPVPSEGGLFKRAKFDDGMMDSEPSDIVRRARYWDLAMSSKTSADYTVGALMGQTADGRIVVLDVVRRQIEWDNVPQLIVETALRDGRGVSIGIEAAFYQTSAVKKVLSRAELHGFSVRGYAPDKDKFTRALPFADRVGAGVVTVMRRAWSEAFISELCSFPNGDHDDQVDAAAGSYLMLGERQKIKASATSYRG